MKSRYINPLIIASCSVLKSAARINTVVGCTFSKQSACLDDGILVIIEICGDSKGKVIFGMKEETACMLASEMMFGREIKEQEEFPLSAIGELANMILGNASTILSFEGIHLNMGIPFIIKGSNIHIPSINSETYCIPLELCCGSSLELDITIEV